jgi:hypothetical protein
VWIIYNQSSWKDQHGEEKPYCRELVQLPVKQSELETAWSCGFETILKRWLLYVETFGRQTANFSQIATVSTINTF